MMILSPDVFIRDSPTTTTTRMPPRKLSSEEAGAELGAELEGGPHCDAPFPASCDGGAASPGAVMSRMMMMMMQGSN